MNTQIGANARIDKSVRFLQGGAESQIVIGDRPNIFRGSEILGPVQIGDDVFIGRDAYIRPRVLIGNRVSIGPFVRLISDTHEVGNSARRAGRNVFLPITIGDGTWIGASVTVVGGVSIGKGCIVAAGSIVTSDVPDNILVGGVPARAIRHLGED